MNENSEEVRNFLTPHSHIGDLGPPQWDFEEAESGVETVKRLSKLTVFFLTQ